MSIKSKLNNKKILIWGYGKEGKSTENFIVSHCPESSVTVFEGKGEEIDFGLYDIVIKSPGIYTEIRNEIITSQTELFLSQFGKQVIGVTGTKGKSTTSSMLYSVLSNIKDRKVLLVGNIGLPCLDYYDEIDENTIIVFELSCHQLNHCRYSPHIAIFLNLFEDHLDYYKTRERYFETKASIARHQDADDYYYHGAGVPPIETKARTYLLPDVNEQLYDIPLFGEHNQFNANVVYTICSKHYGMSDKDIRLAMSKFRGLAHRMEHIGNVGGIDFYDDSISTIPEATIQALQSVPNAKSVIIGGMERNIDYDILEEFIGNHQEFYYIFAYDSGRRIYENVKGLPCCFLTDDLRSAVKKAKEITPSGGACILSPAAASYGYFKNFEDRGDKFRQYVYDETSIVFTGDIGFDKYMQGRWRDENLLSDEIKAFVSSANHMVVNVEGPLMDAPKQEAKEGVEQLKHYMNSEVADFLSKAGADIWAICNNHIMDGGADGIRSTLEIAKKHHARTLGAGMNFAEASRPVIVHEAGGIGMIAVGYQRACRPAGEDTPGCYRWDAMDEIAKSIKEIKSSCRWCIVIAHAGEEFTPLPSPYTRDRYLEYLDLGADAVVSHHPHVPMNYETVGDKIIFYSLGNFIFDTDYQRSQHYTDSGIVLKLKFTEDELSFDALGLKINREKETVEADALPDIFEDVQEADYKLMLPLSVKTFIEATKRQLKFLDPKEYADASEEKWMENFMQPLRSGRVPGEVLDFQILCPIAEKAENNEWKNSKHKKIIDYILHQMQPVEQKNNG